MDFGDILGIRREERRHVDRRQVDRGTHDRRRADRRRRALRGLLFGMFAVAAPSSANISSKLPSIEHPQGVVSVTEDYRAVPATIAYNDAIAEAAALYCLHSHL